MCRLAAAFLLLLAVLPARANLGDSVADCIKRYGKPDTFTEAGSRLPFGTLIFTAGPYQMIVFLYQNVEVGARVTKKDKSAFTSAEMNTILDADAAVPWQLAPSDDPTSKKWSRADKATVTYDTAKSMLIFTTPKMVEVLHDTEITTPTPAPSSATAPTPSRPQGNFAPAAPTPWAPPQPPSTNAAPVTNAP